ncbi:MULTISPECIES: MFS transporter [unclassified Halomonas]|uniref:MFS transporter n=1 Tax=unclassified Halomonas TaxID=2609666 RepID=UPI0007F0F40D|nr:MULTISPECIES: nitrate/nitrite transporter [unclassified Halomonas]SBR51629.1 MFS transporter, NNP family, nitrate/nitrite transporter [Halomonas sp. HL-93]SNY97440.1 MFS transporter, NNP family, nitrate/nitrite transporter [Halomonas sp. hl-4]
MATHRFKQNAVLIANTFAFTMCFMVWTMFGEIGVPIAEELGLNGTQFGTLTAVPILTGAIARLPFGSMTDRYGGRPVFFVVLLVIIPAIWLVQFATAYWQLLMLGAFIGLSGGAFSVGIAYTAKWFEKDRQGLAMGIFGAGNAGAAVTKYIAPTVIVMLGWQAVPNIYAIIMLGTAAFFWFFTFTDPSHRNAKNISLRDQLKVINDPKVWKYCQYYSVVFGGYVGVSLWLTRYYMNEYGFGIQLAALIATIFVLPSGVIRAFGGWLSDRFGAHTVTWTCLWASLIALFIMSYPETYYSVQGAGGADRVEFGFGIPVWLFTAALFVVGISWGIGKASVFKYLSNDYHENLGLVSGIVGLAGGLGGFLLPIMFGALVDLTGVATTVWMLCFGVTFVSIIWMWWTERRVKVLTEDRQTTKD